MIIKGSINEKILKLILVAIISYYFGRIVLQSQVMPIAILALLTFIIAFLVKIEYAFYFLLSSKSIIDILYFVQAGSIRITQVLGSLIVILFVYYVIVVSKYNIFHLLSLNVNKMFGIFLILSIPGVFFTPSLKDGVGFWFKLAQGFLYLNMTVLIVLNAYEGLYKRKMTVISWWIIGSLFLPLAIFYFNYLKGATVKGTGGIDRYATFGAHYNIFPYLLIIVFSFCLFRYLVATKDSAKVSWLTFLGLLVFAIYISYTRNVWMGLTTLLIAWNITRGNLFSTSLILGVFILIFLYNPVVRARFEDLITVLTSDKSFFELDPHLGAGRIAHLQENLRYFLDKSSLLEKLFGNGFGLRISLGRSGLPMAEHNSYLALLMSTGVCGLVAYILYLFALFKETLKLLRSTADKYYKCLGQVFMAILFANMMMNLYDHMIWNLTYQQYFSVFTGFVIAANIIENRKSNYENNYRSLQNN